MVWTGFSFLSQYWLRPQWQLTLELILEAANWHLREMRLLPISCKERQLCWKLKDIRPKGLSFSLWFSKTVSTGRYYKRRMVSYPWQHSVTCSSLDRSLDQLQDQLIWDEPLIKSCKPRKTMAGLFCWKIYSLASIVQRTFFKKFHS